MFLLDISTVPNQLLRIAFVLSMVLLLISGFQSDHSSVMFETQTIDDSIEIGYGLAIGDVDGDGKDDILLADKKQFVWYRNGDWKRFVMVENLTERDNVCIAARDIDGDGTVEVAVGAQWNPGETNDPEKSGSVHYLIPPTDPTEKWESVELPHVPTVHRMRWVRTPIGYQLVMLPLHGIGNKDGEGEGVKVMGYLMNDNDPEAEWTVTVIDQSMHLTHNFEVRDTGGPESLIIGGKEGAKQVTYGRKGWSKVKHIIDGHGFGEIRANQNFVVGIQPMHGNELVLYNQKGARKVLDDNMAQGHALALGDLLSTGQDQIVVGWRNENEEGQLGIKIFASKDSNWNAWDEQWIDNNGMACEDLKLADLDQDGRLDIIAAGRSTKNLKIYWNKN
jgi:hypothetical protein